MDELVRAERAESSGRGRPFQPGNQYRFQPGRSGNPGGRRKMPPELREALKPALKYIVELVTKEGEDTAQRRMAATDVVAYHLGKPGAELLDDSPDDVPGDVVIRALDRIAHVRPKLGKLMEKAKQLLLSEGEVKCVEESQP